MEDFDEWDPMKEDYEDQSFNSYNQGPGQNLPADPLLRKNVCNLFVRGLPPDINENGLCNLLSEFGSVKRVKIVRTPNFTRNLGFIEMGSMSECSAAIQKLNNRRIGDSRIHVEFSKNKEDKARDQRIKQEEDALINSVMRNHNRSHNNSTPNQEVAASQWGISSLNLESNSLPQTISGTRANSRSSDSGYMSDTGYLTRNLAANRKQSSSSSVTQICSEKICISCGIGGSRFTCSQCHAPYCSQQCQRNDWSKHKSTCTPMHEQSRPVGNPNSNGTVPYSSPISSPPNGAQMPRHSPQPATSSLPSSALSATPTASNSSSSLSAPISLPVKRRLRVRLTEFQTPAKFYINLLDCPDLDIIRSALNQHCKPQTNMQASPGDLFAAQLLNRSWERAICINSKYVYLVDVGQKHLCIASDHLPSQLLHLPFQAIECSLYGLLPYKDSWTDFSHRVCTKLGLAVGQVYEMVCVDNCHGNAVLFYMPDGTELGDALIDGTAAKLEPNSQYSIYEGVQCYLSAGDRVKLVIEPSSIESANGFYAQVMAPKIQPAKSMYNMMKQAMQSYGQKHQPEYTNYKGVPGQFVLALHDNQWLRGEVCAANDQNVVVGCMDIGNIALLEHSCVMPLPRLFSHLPMLACKITLSGCQDKDDEAIKQKAIELIKANIDTSALIDAEVVDFSLTTLSVRNMMTSSNRDLAQLLLSEGVVSPCTAPLEDSVLAYRAQFHSNKEQQRCIIEQTPTIPRQPSNLMPARRIDTNQQHPSANESNAALCAQYESVIVLPLFDKGSTHTVRLRKLDNTPNFSVNFPQQISRCVDELNKMLLAEYSNSVRCPLKVSQPRIGMFVVVHTPNNQWRRGFVTRVSTAKRMAMVQYIDEGENAKISYDHLYYMLPQLAQTRIQAIPICCLEGISNPELKNAILKPYMQDAINITILSYNEHGVYTVTATKDGRKLKEPPGRKVWLPGQDAKFTQLTCGEKFSATILAACSPAEIYINPANDKEVQALLECLSVHNSVLPSKPPLLDPQEGELIFVLCSEFGEFDRAIVLSCDGETVTVRSADYGSTYTEPLQNAREMTCEAAAHPLRAIRCQLEGVEHRSSAEVEEYMKTISQQLCQVTLKSSASSAVQPPSCQVLIKDECLNSKVLSMLPPPANPPISIGEEDMMQQNSHLNGRVASPNLPALISHDGTSATDVNARISALEQALFPLHEEVMSLRRENQQMRQLLENRNKQRLH